MTRTSGRKKAADSLFDLDYIVEWVRPTPPERLLGFWISPATLVFHDVRHIRGGNLDLDSYDFWLDIQDLGRSDPDAFRSA